MRTTATTMMMMMMIVVVMIPSVGMMMMMIGGPGRWRRPPARSPLAGGVVVLVVVVVRVGSFARAREGAAVRVVVPARGVVRVPRRPRRVVARVGARAPARSGEGRAVLLAARGGGRGGGGGGGGVVAPGAPRPRGARGRGAPPGLRAHARGQRLRPGARREIVLALVPLHRLVVRVHERAVVPRVVLAPGPARREGVVRGAHPARTSARARDAESARRRSDASDADDERDARSRTLQDPVTSSAARAPPTFASAPAPRGRGGINNESRFRCT